MDGFRTVVKVDGSRPSRAALEWAVAEARMHNGSIKAVTAARRIAAGVFAFAGVMLTPESMSGPSFLVAVNALLLKRLKLPRPDTPDAVTAHPARPLAPAPAGHH